MGYCARPTEEMGPFSVEVSSESFTIDGLYDALPYVYPENWPHGGKGTVEFSLSDIPKLRALLDQVERVSSGNRLPTD